MGVNLPAGSRFRLAGLVAAVFVIGVIVGISLYPLLINTPNSPTTYTSITTTPAVQSLVSQSAVVLNTNSTFSIQISSVALDQVDSPTGYSDYLVSVVAYYVGGGSWQLNPSNFHLATNELSVYDATSVSAERNPLGNIVLMSGQRVSGQVAFAVLNGQKPTKLQYYTDPSSVLVETDNIPEISSWVSLVQGAIANYVNPTTSNLTVMASIVNSTQYFYSTDMIVVKMTISYEKVGNDPSSITVKTIDEQDPGFTIVSTNPLVPINIPGNNQTVSITLTVSPPRSSYSGGIHIGIGLTD
jgi:hypothetical protein